MNINDMEILRKKTGNLSQIAGIERLTVNGGKAGGMRVTDLKTGGGLFMRLLDDKALDIYRLEYKGVNIGFVSKPGLTSPYMYDQYGLEFLRTFQGGFLFTCGLSNVGAPCTDAGVTYPFHGRIGHTPAENVCSREYIDGNSCIFEVSGDIREAALYGENLVLRRKVSAALGSDTFTIEDRIRNEGFETRQIMLLYHMNIGYPILDTSARLYMPSVAAKSRETGEQISYDHTRFPEPEDEKGEEVAYHDLRTDDTGYTCTAIYNHRINTGVIIEYKLNELPCFTHWRSMKTGDYVTGLEPGNCHPDGRIVSREKKESWQLEPGDERKISLSVTIIEGEKLLTELLSKYGMKI